VYISSTDVGVITRQCHRSNRTRVSDITAGRLITFSSVLVVSVLTIVSIVDDNNSSQQQTNKQTSFSCDTLLDPNLDLAKMMLLNLLLVATLCFSDAYSPFGMTTCRSSMTMKRGRGSFKKEMEGSSPSSFSKPSSSFGSSSSSSSSSSRNWLPVPNQTTKALPTEEGKVTLLETNVKTLVDAGTNPAGAVSVVKYGKETYCFSVQCPSCKIPLTKAKVLPANEETAANNSPRLSCDFCKATYSLKTGEKLKSESASGILGSIAKTLISASPSGPLPVYQLGEKDGKILISLN
jgi:nitrite reductase/ring-hydroxylating ferredoxin subunit